MVLHVDIHARRFSENTRESSIDGQVRFLRIENHVRGLLPRMPNVLAKACDPNGAMTGRHFSNLPETADPDRTVA